MCTVRWPMWLCYYRNRSQIKHRLRACVPRDDICNCCYGNRSHIQLCSPLSSRINTLTCDSTWVTSHSFLYRVFEYPPKWCTYSAGMAGATWNCCRLGASSVYTKQPCHFMQSHIRKVYACLAVTCHMHFWQNDRHLSRATAVTRGWNGYRNKSQHRKLTLEKKILSPLQQGFEPATFRLRVRRSNHWAIPAPHVSRPLR